jgi:hypothetical protein
MSLVAWSFALVFILNVLATAVLWIVRDAER